MKNELFNVSETYDVITPESAENGDFAESDFNFEDKKMCLRDILDTLENYGGFENLQQNDGDQSLYEIDPDIDFQTAGETRRALHIEGSKRAMMRLIKILGRKE